MLCPGLTWNRFPSPTRQRSSTSGCSCIKRMGLRVHSSTGKTSSGVNTIARIYNDFQTLLGSITMNPDMRLDQLEMRTEAEREKLRAEEEQSRTTQTQRIRSTRRKVE